MAKVIKISTESAVEIVELPGTDVHAAVEKEFGGYAERVHARSIQNPYLLLVDENGQMKELLDNDIASALYGGQIVGDVFFVEEDSEGYIVQMNDKNLEEALVAVEHVKELVEIFSLLGGMSGAFSGSDCDGDCENCNREHE